MLVDERTCKVLQYQPMKHCGNIAISNHRYPLFVAVQCRPARPFRSMPPTLFATRVSAEEAQKLLDDAGYAYLDVRTPEEYANGHVPGAVNVPVMLKSGMGMAPNPDFVQQVQEKFPDTSANICVGCQAGRRSEAAVAMLEQAVRRLNHVVVHGKPSSM